MVLAAAFARFQAVIGGEVGGEQGQGKRFVLLQLETLGGRVIGASVEAFILR